jgi:hypothetical protein
MTIQSKLKARILACLIAMLMISTFSLAQESKFQAIFLYKFIESTSWPQDKKNLLIGVIGDSEMQPEMEKMLQIRNNTSLKIKKISAAEAASCDIIFLPSSADAHFQAVKEKVAGKSILFVTESADLAAKGAGISFIKQGNKLNFAINKAAVEAGKLKLANSLLALGKPI